MEQVQRRRRIKRAVQFICLAVVVAVVAAAWPERRVEVQTVEVTKGTVEKLVTSVQAGEVRAKRQVGIRATTAGRVSRISVSKGDRVEKGKLLVELENRTLRARFDLARANLEVGRSAVRSAELRLVNAERNLARAKKLASKGVVSRQALERAQAERDMAAEALESAKANMAQLEASVKVALAALEETRMRAPFAGLVAQVHVEEGETLVAGTPVLELVDDSGLTVVAPVDEADASTLATGMQARVLNDAYRAKQLVGKLVWISPLATRDIKQNRQLLVEVGFDGTKPDLKPGMSADIEIIVARRQNTLWIPTNALMRRDGRQLVYLVTGGRARLQQVRTGISNWERTEVTEGLEEGQHVIVSLDARGLADGVAVRPRNLPAARALAW